MRKLIHRRVLAILILACLGAPGCAGRKQPTAGRDLRNFEPAPCALWLEIQTRGIAEKYKDEENPAFHADVKPLAGMYLVDDAPGSLGDGLRKTAAELGEQGYALSVGNPTYKIFVSVSFDNNQEGHKMRYGMKCPTINGYPGDFYGGLIQLGTDIVLQAGANAGIAAYNADLDAKKPLHALTTVTIKRVQETQARDVNCFAEDTLYTAEQLQTFAASLPGKVAACMRLPADQMETARNP